MMVNLRKKRDQLLVDTDWMGNSDVTMSNAWKKYRQDLRDITNGVDTLTKAKNKKFPTKPE